MKSSICLFCLLNQEWWNNEKTTIWLRSHCAQINVQKKQDSVCLIEFERIILCGYLIVLDRFSAKTGEIQ